MSYIKSRLRKSDSRNITGKEKEYFFSLRTPDDTGYLYHDWMTVQELAEIEGCELTPDGVRNRLRNATHSEKFSTIEKCVFTPKMVNGNNTKMNRITNLDIKESLEKSLFEDHLKLVKLWPASSVWKEARIIQCKEFT